MAYLDCLRLIHEEINETELTPIEEIEIEIESLRERYGELLAKLHLLQGKTCPCTVDEALTPDKSSYRYHWDEGTNKLEFAEF